jgi:prolipoprotein diacylglyceryltransferase
MNALWADDAVGLARRSKTMFDIHERLYGVNSFIVFGVIPVYSFFVGLGLLMGVLYYLCRVKQRGIAPEGAAKIVFGGLSFGVLGSKIPLILEGDSLLQVIYGKSIVGALLGGMFGVMFIKRVFHIKMRLGNIIAPAAAFGLSIGRWGCFFNGCCYGVSASFGFDFGDGVLRLPTQLYESAFHFGCFIILHFLSQKEFAAGILFRWYLFVYFVFRFFMEMIRCNPVIYLGMSIYQLICIVSVIYLGITLWFYQKRLVTMEGKR